MTKHKSFFDMLAAASEAIGKDEFGASKECTCPICQIRRAAAEVDKAENVEEPQVPIQTVAYFATKEDSISIGHTIATDTDTTQRIAIRIGSDTDGMLFEIHEARLIIDALQMAIERIEY